MQSNRLYSVFISYASEDLAAAENLDTELCLKGIETWFDKRNILPGADWRHEIKDGISKSSYFIALLSKNSVNKRGYVQKELKIALDVLDEFPEGDIFIIPARLDDCKPRSDRLCSLQWVDLFPDWTAGMRGLLKVLLPPLPDISLLNTVIERNHEKLGFEVPNPWRDNRERVYWYHDGDDDVYIVWDTELACLQKFYKAVGGKWSGPHELVESEIEQVRKIVSKKLEISY
jgi:hypothetical protein